MRLLYLCDADGGGIAEYAIRQCHALGEAGAKVTFLCRPSFDVHRLQVSKVTALLPTVAAGRPPRVVRMLRQIKDSRSVAKITVGTAELENFDALLLACYQEYFSPFWAPILRAAAASGLRIGTIAHDPVRDFVVGPVWWHRWSVRQAYSFVRDVFVHDGTPVDFGGPQPVHLTTHVIPHGPFEVSSPRQSREKLRQLHGFADSDTVFLSFGQIRDGKNLDRFLRAMTLLPDSVKLLVTGSGGSGSQRPPDYYVGLATELGVADRCVWDLRYVPDEETGDLFELADHVLLTYSAKFRSASGVLNAAVSCRRTVLASSGSGPLKSAVENYRLGRFVEPDDDESILQGAQHLMWDQQSPDWDRYEAENSWNVNALGILSAFGSDP